MVAGRESTSSGSGGLTKNAANDVSAPTAIDVPSEEAKEKDPEAGREAGRLNLRAKCPELDTLFSRGFLLSQMRSSMVFFDPRKCIDDSDGGFHHFFDEKGRPYDTGSRVLVTQARFVFSYAVAAQHLGRSGGEDAAPDFLQTVRRGVEYLGRGSLRNDQNGTYYWTLSAEGGRDARIYTYGLAQCLLAYAAALRVGAAEAKPYLEETFTLLEKHFWEPSRGLYAEEADASWLVNPDYRSQSGNLHVCEASIAAYEATGERKYLDRALVVAENICRRQAETACFVVDFGAARRSSHSWGLLTSATTCAPVWEHFDGEWEPDVAFANDSDKLKIFRPWGFQPGHQVEWARFLIVLDKHARQLRVRGNDLDSDARPSTPTETDASPSTCSARTSWLLDKARHLFAVAVELGWDATHGGLAYSFDLKGEVCDFDKIFWVQCESLGTCAMLMALEQQQDRDWQTSGSRYSAYARVYESLWKYCWELFVDHENGSWRRRLNREGKAYFTEKTKAGLCVDPDFHIMGGFAGALAMMEDESERDTQDVHVVRQK